jgi:lysine 6-dehydrogenase
MGPAAAYNAINDPQVQQVTLADISPAQLTDSRAKLAYRPQANKLAWQLLDLADWAATTYLMGQHDVIIAALPSNIIPLGLHAAFAVGKPWVDLSWPAGDQVDALREEAAQTGVLVIPGCGVEPGLTEIIAHHLAEQFDQVDELHIKCGGIPSQPTPPLGYKIVFGGRRLPLRAHDALMVQAGKLVSVPRYSGVETLHFGGVGETEAWHEGFVPWLLELDVFQQLQVGTQKTVRWPGYAAKVTVLKELGLLSDALIEVDGLQVAPRRVVDTLLYPYVCMNDQDRDITCLRVEVVGHRDGQPVVRRAEMIDRYDEQLGFTSMARVTAFTAAIVARMVGRGELQGGGFVTPEKLVIGPHFDLLRRELAAAGVHFQLSA